MERLKSTIDADENFLIITPVSKIQDNSIYTIRIKGLKSVSGKYLPAQNFEIITKVTPMYCTLSQLKTLVEAFSVPDRSLISFIQSASMEADFISGGEADPDDFAVQQFTKLRAVIDCLLHGCMIKTQQGGTTYTLGDATFIDGANSNAFKNLIKLLQDELKKWQDAIRGYYNEGRVKPKATRIGINSASNSDVSWTSVDTMLNDLTRTFPQWS